MGRYLWGSSGQKGCLKHFINCKMPLVWLKPVHYINFSLFCCRNSSQRHVSRTLVCICLVVGIIMNAQYKAWADTIIFSCPLRGDAVWLYLYCLWSMSQTLCLAPRHMKLMEVYSLYLTAFVRSIMVLKDFYWRTSLSRFPFVSITTPHIAHGAWMRVGSSSDFTGGGPNVKTSTL